MAALIEGNSSRAKGGGPAARSGDKLGKIPESKDARERRARDTLTIDARRSDIASRLRTSGREPARHSLADELHGALAHQARTRLRRLDGALHAIDGDGPQRAGRSARRLCRRTRSRRLHSTRREGRPASAPNLDAHAIAAGSGRARCEKPPYYGDFCGGWTPSRNHANVVVRRRGKSSPRR